MGISTRTLILFILLVLLGGLIYIVFFFPDNTNNAIITKVINQYNPVSQKPQSVSLTLSSPDDNQLVSDNNLLVSGDTNPNTTVVVSGDDFDDVIKSNDQGHFSDTVSLSLGVNILTIAVFDQNGNSKSETRNIYYSKDSL